MDIASLRSSTEAKDPPNGAPNRAGSVRWRTSVRKTPGCREGLPGNPAAVKTSITWPWESANAEVRIAKFSQFDIPPVPLAAALGVGDERFLELIGETEVIHHKPAGLVAEDAVHSDYATCSV